MIIIIVMMGSAILLMSSCSEKESVTPGNDSLSDKTLEAVDYTQCNCLSDTLPYEELSEAETDALTVMREEELLAHDVYVFLSELYTIPVFSNISRSELQHSNAIAGLLVKYSLPDIAADHQPGVFVNQDLQSLYNVLTAQGEISLTEALKVGATIEDLDIKDLMDLREAIDNQDIGIVFANLTKGSRNHLRSFSTLLSRRGVTYIPQFISQELYDQIINSPHERGCVNN